MTITFLSAIKPHYSLEEMKTMGKEIEPKRATNISEFLRAQSTGASFGNIDASDLKPPQLKLLAGQSPEVLDGVPDARPGNFWMTILNQNLGQFVTGSPILLKKTYNVWAPKGPGAEQKGPLAVASDGINWDIPNQSFDVKFPGNPQTYTWKLGRTVTETGADKFGSQQHDDKSSKPIATLTYNVLWLIDLPSGKKQLCVFTTSRTGVTPTKNFVSTVEAIRAEQGLDQFYQRYKIVIQKKNNSAGDSYFSFDYQYIGEVENMEDAKRLRGLYDTYVKSGFVAEREEGEVAPKPAHEVRPVRSDDDEIPF